MVVHGHRWWTAAELMSIAETTYPGRIGELVARVLKNGIPAEPWALTD